MELKKEVTMEIYDLNWGITVSSLPFIKKEDAENFGHLTSGEPYRIYEKHIIQGKYFSIPTGKFDNGEIIHTHMFVDMFESQENSIFARLSFKESLVVSHRDEKECFDDEIETDPRFYFLVSKNCLCLSSSSGQKERFLVYENMFKHFLLSLIKKENSLSRYAIHRAFSLDLRLLVASINDLKILGKF